MSKSAAIFVAIGLVMVGCDKPNHPAPSWEDQWNVHVQWDAADGRFLLNGVPAKTMRLWDFAASAVGGEPLNAELRSLPGQGIQLSGDAADPALRILVKPGVRGDRATIVAIRLTRLKPVGRWDGSLYYSTPRHGESARFRTSPSIAAEPPVGTPVVLVYNASDLMAGDDDWLRSTIVGLRMDLEAEGGGEVIVHQVALLAEDAG